MFAFNFFPDNYKLFKHSTSQPLVDTELVKRIGQLPQELIDEIKAFCFTPTKNNIVRHFYIADLFWTYFYIYMAKQRLSTKYGTFSDWLTYRLRHSSKWSLNELQIIWKDTYLRNMQSFAKQLFPCAEMNRQKIIRHYELLDNDTDTLFFQFRAFRFDAQLNAHVTPINNRNAPNSYTVYTAHGIEKRLAMHNGSTVDMMQLLQQILYYHTMISTDYVTPLLLPVLVRLNDCMIDLLETMTMMTLLLLAKSNDLKSIDLFGSDLPKEDHIFLESMFECISLFFMQCPIGLLNHFAWLVKKYTADPLTTLDTFYPEFICGFLVTPLYRYDQERSCYHHHLQQLAQFYHRSEQSDKMDPVNLHLLQPFWVNNYVFRLPYRLLHAMDWDRIHHDKLCTLMTSMNLPNSPYNYVSLAIANHFYSLLSSNIGQEKKSWMLFDYKGCPRTNTCKNYPLHCIEIPNHIPNVIYDMTEEDMYAEQRLFFDESYLVDHRLLNKCVLLMNDFYLQSNDLFYKNQFSFILERNYLLLANNPKVYERMQKYLLMAMVYPKKLAEPFLKDLLNRLYTALKIDNPGIENKLLFNLNTFDEMTRLMLYFGFLNDQLYEDVQQTLSKSFEMIYYPLQHTHKQKLKLFLRSKEFREWVSSRKLRFEYDMEQIFSV